MSIRSPYLRLSTDDLMSLATARLGLASLARTLWGSRSSRGAFLAIRWSDSTAFVIRRPTRGPLGPSAENASSRRGPWSSAAPAWLRNAYQADRKSVV